jgi:hypothetical protein
MKLGITGHQRLAESSAWAWVESALDRELRTLMPPLTAITSLAIGSDQLLAALVLRYGGDIHAVVPFPDYERTFSAADGKRYRELLNAAASVEVLDTPGTDEDAYLAAGKRVVQLADMMIAVWNGAVAKGKGGTADIVAFAETRAVPLIHINPADRSVARIRT